MSIRHANEQLQSDELEKFDRILDEFLADIMTTIQIPCSGVRSGKSFAEEYAIEPLMEKRSVDEAITTIRGIYRGRSIIPRVWYELAKSALQRLSSIDLDRFRHAYHGSDDTRKALSALLADDYVALNNMDLAQAFGMTMTMDSKKEHWLLLGNLFDYWDTDHNHNP